MECTRLSFYGRYDEENPMAPLSPQKRKKRRVQLREAQRRRRARLKDESKSFLQIILSQEMLLYLRRYSDLVGKPLHACAAELIERGLSHPHELSPQQPNEQPPADVPENLQPYNGADPENLDPLPAKKNPGPDDLSADQMELFKNPKVQTHL
jgi:hypothetical protein